MPVVKSKSLGTWCMCTDQMGLLSGEVVLWRALAFSSLAPRVVSFEGTTALDIALDISG